jgi:V8-like Glu-specific endopeptidase
MLFFGVGSGGFISILVSLFIFAQVAQAAIFGIDTREKITPFSKELPLARSTAIAVLSSNFVRTSPLTIDLDPDDSSDFLCRDVKYAEDPSLSYACTGFLVAPDLIATAGHCMVNVGQSRDQQQTYCEAFSWLFDYQDDGRGHVQTAGLSSDKLYECRKIIYAVHDEKPPYRDFALVQLKRPVTDRAPLALSKQRELRPGEALRMIGYPLGQPAKLSRDAGVLLNDPAKQSFIANLDAFEGNSGSPVFNAQDEVIGILIGGTPSESLLQDEHATCRRYNVCDDLGNNCEAPDRNLSSIPDFQITGSIVQRIEPVQKLIENLPLQM